MATLGDDDNGKRKAIREFTRNKSNDGPCFIVSGGLVDRVIDGWQLDLFQQPANSHLLLCPHRCSTPLRSRAPGLYVSFRERQQTAAIDKD